MSRGTHVFFSRMRSELPGEHVQYILIYPSALGERSECKIVWVNFSQT